MLSTKIRDYFLSKWLEYMESPAFTMERAEISILMYGETFNAIVKSNRPELKERIVQVLQRVMDISRKYDMPDLVKLCLDYIQKTHTLYQVLSQWQGRGQMEDIPFPPEFFSSGSSLTTFRKMAEKEADELKSIFTKLQPGVYITCLFITEDEIMADENGLLPMVLLSDISYETVENIDFNGSDFEWLTSLGKSWSKTCASIGDSMATRKTSSVFLRSLVKATKVLVDKFDTDIGILYDRLILIPQIKKGIILTVKQVKETFTPPGYTWERIEALELRLYQGYYSVQLDVRLDRMDSGYGGMRWIHNAINYYNTSPLLEGIYLCYVRYVWRM